MTLWRGLSKRIVVAAVVCGMAGLVMSLLLVRFTFRESVIRATAPLAIATYRDFGHSRCEASPRTWVFHDEGGATAYAYDADTLKSANPDAPPLDASYAHFDRDLGIEARGLRLGGALVFRGAASGPCALVRATWGAPRGVGDRLLFVLVTSTLLVSSVAAALAFLAVVRPLTRRIERLRFAAERVGDAASYAPAERDDDPERDALGDLSSSLDRAHDRIRKDASALEQRQRDLQRYLADVAHDLRTPITSLQLALEQAADAPDHASSSELLSRALKDTVYLAGLTSNLRLASQLREGWTPASRGAEVDLRETVERVVGRARFFAKRQGIALDAAFPDDAVPAACDPIAAEQAIGNLVENAIAYGDPGGHVAVVLAITGDRFTITVVDDGPGVAPVEIPRLGERTFRSDEARQRDPRGSGLGLAITSEVCARCAWTLAFETAAPRGLRVSIDGAWGKPAT